jgi:hypothetical protein
VTSAYVYYRIDPAQAQLAADRIDALLRAMAMHCSLPPRRMSRCDDPETWMEIYEGIADFAAFATASHAAAQDFDCAAFTRDERHMECFCAPDAAP